MNDMIYDVIMVGAGPSSLTAAVYTTRENLSTLVVEKGAVGGLVATIDKIDNYPGFPDGVEGYDLSEQLKKQAERFGTKIEYGDVSSIRDEGDFKVVTIDSQEVKAKTVLIASGSGYRKLNIPGEKEYLSRGVHYCATCDGAFYQDKRLAVIGGGNSAVQEAMFLTRFASHIDLISIGNITASEVLRVRLKEYEQNSKISVHTKTETKEIMAPKGRVSAVKIIENGNPVEISVDGVFVFVGLAPNTDFLDGSGIELDNAGF
ncbi:MAG: FAD-dependent oxidoreductase, partial [Candidatus Saccharimonadaceae bacterium]|nr:FAD-dependent oxidoreductase [Candidatus Saccharimonadaceae bacterium]